MDALGALILVLVSIAGLGVVLTRDPARQAAVVSMYGLLLSLMFFVFQAPDVALAQITIGALVLPLMMLLALARIRRNRNDHANKS